MKIRILDRVLIFLAGLLMIAGCTAFVLQVFFQTDVLGMAGDVLARQSVLAKIVFALTALILLALGVYCVMILFRRPAWQDRYVKQKTETGELDISLDTMKDLVQKCLDQHPEIHAGEVELENHREGLEIRIAGDVAGGVSIPLTVDTIQKQIKQYVTACTGVEISNIRVQIDATGKEIKGAPFAIEPPAGVILLREGEKKAAETAEETPAEEPPAELADLELPAEAEEAKETPEEPPVSPIHSIQDSGTVIDDPTEEDDRPIHQRLFSTKEEPCIVPVPPELENEETEQETAPEGKDMESTEQPASDKEKGEQA